MSHKFFKLRGWGGVWLELVALTWAKPKWPESDINIGFSI